MPLEKSLTPISAFAVYKNQQSQNGFQQKKKKKKKRKIPETPATKPAKMPKLKINKATKADEINTKRKHNIIRIKNKKPARQVESDDEDEEIPQLIEMPKPTTTRHEIIDDPSLEFPQLLKWLISPVKPEDFFNNYWEDEVLHIKRNKPTYYSHILSSETLDRILRDNHLCYTKNIDVVSYEKGVKEVFNQEGRATPSALWDYYNNGCSIRVLNPQTYNHKVHLLISTLQELFGTMVGTNVYLTPPGSQGFAPHFDDIEAFIVQLEGRKHWKLYHPKENDVLCRDSSPNFNKQDLGDPFMELTLEAGDILYFPRGTIHEGRTDSQKHSLHITISVYQHTAYVDLLEIMLPKALKKAAENNVAFRRGLPLNYLKHLGAAQKGDKSVRKSIEDYVKDLVSNLDGFLDFDGAADQLGRKFVHDSMPPVLSASESRRSSKFDGAFMKNGKVYNNVEITLDTRVRLLRYYCIRLVQEENSSPRLYFSAENSNVYHGEDEQWLELEPVMVSAIKTLQNSYPDYVAVDKIPMDDAIMKMQLISDLWEKGLLITEAPLPTFDGEDEDSSD